MTKQEMCCWKALKRINEGIAVSNWAFKRNVSNYFDEEQCISTGK
jgi:hypothetical protein